MRPGMQFPLFDQYAQNQFQGFHLQERNQVFLLVLDLISPILTVSPFSPQQFLTSFELPHGSIP